MSEQAISWRRRDGVLGCKRFMTQKCYDAQSPLMKANYEPFRCADFDTLAQRLQEAERLLQIAYDHGQYRRLSDQELGRIDAFLAGKGGKS